jgi:SH3 domain-containing YSC84-like protein 1
MKLKTWNEKGRRAMKPSLAMLILLGFAGSGLAGSDEDAQRLKEAGTVLGEIESAPDKAIPNDLFHKASCVVVIPSMKKAGFIFSGKYGRGYASCRKANGGWTSPAGMRIEGGGFGLQVGGSATDVVMLVMSQKGMDGLLASKFTLGGEASVAAGPVGRDATAQTDATMRADILSWSRSRGVFAGLSLQGGTLRPDDDANKSLYGEKITSAQLLTGKVRKSLAPDLFVQKLTEYAGAGSTN